MQKIEINEVMQKIDDLKKIRSKMVSLHENDEISEKVFFQVTDILLGELTELQN